MSKCVVVSGHHSGGPFTLLGIPGRYQNGVPVPVESTGLSEAELRRRLERAGLKVKIEDPDAKTKTETDPAKSAEKEG